MWTWVVGHQTDVIIAIVLAVICAIIFGLIIAVFFEAFGIGSKIRDSIRSAKNKTAERSISQLSDRIASQQAYRNSISTEHGIIVVLFRAILLILLLMSFIGIFVMVAHSDLVPVIVGRDLRRLLDTAAVAYLALAAFAAFTTVKLATLDTREKASAKLAQLDIEIGEMKKRLEILKKSHPNEKQS
jgi:hypothetical protein